MDINICTIHDHIQNIQNDIIYLVKLYVSVEFVLKKTNFEIVASKWDYGFWRENTVKNSLMMNAES